MGQSLTKFFFMYEKITPNHYFDHHGITSLMLQIFVLLKEKILHVKSVKDYIAA